MTTKPVEPESETVQTTAAHATAEARATLRRNWVWIALLGAALVASGVAAIAMPVIAGVAVTAVVGAAMLIGGVIQAVDAFSESGWKGRAWSAVSAAVYLLGGALLLLNPFSGTVALSLLMLAIFLVDGVVRVFLGLSIRPERGWGWLTATGALSATLAILILAFFLPGASLTLLGLVAGVSLIMEGWAFIFMAFAARPKSDREVYPDADDRIAHG